MLVTNANQTTKMAQNLVVGKNALWTAYQDAVPLKRAEITLELKKASLYRHWYSVASKEGHDLPNAKASLRDIFLKVMPETAPLFGLPPVNKAPVKKPKPAMPSTPTLFD